MLQGGENPQGLFAQDVRGTTAHSFLCSFTSELLEVLVHSKKQESGNATRLIFSRLTIENLWKVTPFCTCADCMCHLPCDIRISPLFCLKYYRNSASPDLSSLSLFIFYKMLLKPKAQDINGAAADQTLVPDLSRLWFSWGVFPWLPDGINHLCIR